VEGIKEEEVKAQGKRMERKSTNRGHNMTMKGRNVKLIF
jgi:hypothetical protein